MIKIVGDIIEFDGYRVGVVVRDAPYAVVQAFIDTAEACIDKKKHDELIEEAEENADERAAAESAKRLHPFISKALEAIERLETELEKKDACC